MTQDYDRQHQARAPLLDVARGLAVVAMVIFHFSWDLHHYNLYSVDVSTHPYWRLFSQSIAASFLILVGISLERATREGVRWPAFLKRLALVAGGALLVTISTGFQGFMADSSTSGIVYFGILHAIAAFSVFGLAFRRWPVWALVAAAAFVFALPQFWRSDLFNDRSLAWIGLARQVPFSVDFEPVFPWFAFVLIGISIGRLQLAALESTAPLARTGLLQVLGRWSLAIYLVHQPIMIGGFEALNAFGLLQPATFAGQFERQCVADCKVQGANPALCEQVCNCTVSAMHQETTIFRMRRPITEGDRSAISRITQKCMAAYTPRP